ncbi:MAG: glycine--tRNA ligase subunit beta [Buchnera aphidicola (Periphyllus acericola)]|uniref:glycine--tRNA ligase subunit beta n=1 Tax=Buchnera aphidicola TaxID=9 RepID=UPI0030D36929|nr:glycine--tRNA ligase subunit beta [Buchnera aphidicola (Periphyllus acericola)]
MKKKTFLVEIRVEDIPANSLKKIAKLFYKKYIEILKKKEITYKKINWFATHRKLAIKIKNISYKKKKKITIKKGPPVLISFDKFGKFQKPALSWIKKFKINKKKIEIYKEKKKEWICFKKKIKNKKYEKILPKITKKSIYKISHPHFMKWKKKKYKFIRPVRNIIMLLNDKVIPYKIFNLKTNNYSQNTLSNNFSKIKILNAKNYEKILLKKGKIYVDYKKRKKIIINQIKNLKKKNKSYLKINKNLLNEINSLVEQPKSLISSFKKKYLIIPQKIIIYILEKTLKSFPLFKKNGKLNSYFIFIINLKTKNYTKIITEYKSVIESKLQDISFFIKKDTKNSLKNNKKLLKNVLFYKNLGNLYDKTNRLKEIIKFFSKIINFNIKNAKKAASLSKCDIVSSLVLEFSELQGIAGSYYAKNNNEIKEVYKAIEEQYKPIHEKDSLPITKIGISLALSDKFDNLIGLFLIGEIPKGNKDPFALRRTAIGIIKIIIKNKISFNLNLLIKKIINLYNIKKKNIEKKILNFIINRLNNFYKSEKIKKIIKSIINFKKINLLKINKKINLILKFILSKHAKKILILNKRIDNILKNKNKKIIYKINLSLLKHKIEKKIVQKIKKLKKKINYYNYKKKYKNSLKEIIKIHKIVEKFFNQIKINHNIKKIKINRLSIIYKLKKIFSKVIKFSYLY